MPLNVRRFCTPIIFTTISAAGAVSGQATQQPPAATQQVAATQTPAVKPPTSGDVMRDRISKAKAFIAVRNYNAAIYELENIRRETSDGSVNAVSNVLLMNSYLEQGDYKRAGEFVTELYTLQKTGKPGAGEFYAAVSAQVVKSARNQIDRYRALGLTVSDRNLPLEAVNDIERMRETLELVVTQAKEMSADKTKTTAAMGMLEEATTTRSALARDDYDARRWRDAVSDSREQLANSRSVITNAVDGTTTQSVVMKNTAAIVPALTPSASVPFTYTSETAVPRPSNNDSTPKTTATQSVVSDKPSVPAPIIVGAAKSAEEAKRNRVVAETIKQDPSGNPEAVVPTTAGGDTSPLNVGSLIGYATNQTAPVYPAAAKTIRAAGVVKVEVTINERGDVAAVEKASGPPMLQTAAKDAIRKWKFKPFTRDGQPVKATGFVNFNFNL